jgi:hypothetical protein
VTDTPKIDCPGQDELRHLLQRTLESTRLNLLDDHVEDCLFCQSRMDALSQEEWEFPAELVNANPVTGPPKEDAEAEFIRTLVRSIPTPSGLPDDVPQVSPLMELPSIPGFEHLELIGSGGSGEVYRAWQSELGRWVALKTLAPNRSPERVARVNREARLLARLPHPHIVRIHGIGDMQGQPYLVMEWIAGGSLQDRIRQGPLPIRDAVQFAREIASALEVVHAAGIIHRDLKPANVLLDGAVTGETAGRATVVARLTDFSIAFDPESNERLSQTGMVIGTPDYMAPEQTGLLPQGAEVGPAADIYGVGAVLYAALTGRPPHHAESPVAVLHQVATREPPPPRRHRPEIPRDLETIVQKCLRREPTQRYRSAGELAQDLQRYLDGRPIHARPYRPGERAWNWVRRRPAVAATGAIVLGLGLVLIAAAIEQERQRQTLVSRLAHQTDETEKAAALGEASLADATYSRWQTIRQLLLKAEAQLQSGSLAPEQQRGLIETMRRHLRNRLDDADAMTPAFAVEFAEKLNGWAGLEEQSGFLPQALEDGNRLDTLLSKLEDADRPQSLTLASRRRQVRLLDRLNRLDEANQQMMVLLATVVSGASEGVVTDVLDAVVAHARGLQEAGRREQTLALVRQVQHEWWSTGDPGSRPLRHSRALLELQLLELDLVSPVSADGEPTATEMAWRETLRQVFERQRTSVMSHSVDPVRAAERLADLARHRPHLVQPTRENWQQEIQRLDPVNHAGERLVHQFEFGAAAGLPEWPALQTVRQFFDQRPDDLATRRRVAEVLVRRGQTASPDNATSALAQTRLAIDLVLSASEPWRTSQEGRSLLAEAYRAEAAILRAQGSLSTARQSLEVALSHSPDDRRAALYLDLVQLHLDLGDRTQAESILTRIGEGTEARAQAERLLQEASQIETRSP